MDDGTTRAGPGRRPSGGYRTRPGRGTGTAPQPSRAEVRGGHSRAVLGAAGRAGDTGGRRRGRPVPGSSNARPAPNCSTACAARRAEAATARSRPEATASAGGLPGLPYGRSNLAIVCRRGPALRCWRRQVRPLRVRVRPRPEAAQYAVGLLTAATGTILAASGCVAASRDHSPHPVGCASSKAISTSVGAEPSCLIPWRRENLSRWLLCRIARWRKLLLPSIARPSRPRPASTPSP